MRVGQWIRRTSKIGPKLPVADRPTKVSLASLKRDPTETDMKSALRASATAVSDFAWLSRGDSVFIKTALNSSYPYPSTTNPVAVAAMIELLKDKGAGSVIVGDMSGIEHVKLSAEGTVGRSRALMEKSGRLPLYEMPVVRSIALKRRDGAPFTKTAWKQFPIGKAPS